MIPIRSSRRTRSDQGAALVEFALVLPFLLLLLMGIVEFAWLFAQNLDVRHGAREGARLIAVNFNPNTNTGNAQTADIVAEVQARMDSAAGPTVSLEACGSGTVGDGAKAEVSATATTLTGLLDWAIPSPLILRSGVEIRIEQPATWADNVGSPTC